MDEPTVRKISLDGSIRYYTNGHLHREDGPAVIRQDGSEFWYRNGMFHRIDGPAITWCDGEKEWFLYGMKLDPILWMIKAHEFENEE